MIFFNSDMLVLDYYLYFTFNLLLSFVSLKRNSLIQTKSLNFVVTYFHILQRPLKNNDLLGITFDTSSGLKSQIISEVPNLFTQ